MIRYNERWIQSGEAVVLDPDLVLQFVEYLDTLPWFLSSLDWDKIRPHTEVNRANVTADEFLSWALASALGQHTHMAFVVSPSMPSLVTEVEFGIRNLSSLFLHYPGVNFCFGVDRVGSAFVCSFAHILQYEGEEDTQYAVAGQFGFGA